MNQFAQSNAADLDFIITRFLNVAGNAQDTCARVVRLTQFCILCTATKRDDMLDIAQGFNIVDNGWALIESQHRREIRRFDSGISALSFERFNEARFFPTDVCARTAMNVDLQVEPALQNICSKESLRSRLG